MAIPTYNQELDTLVSTAIDTYTKDPINALTDSGEKFLKGAASMGRLFVVNDAESVRHPIMYGHGENSSLYLGDDIDGTPAVNNLSATAKEILTHSIFHLQAGTRNINFPQSQPPGNLIDYVSSVVRANMMHILNEEEILFVQGRPGGSTGNQTARDPFTTDTNYSAGFPMSLLALMTSSTTPHWSADGDATNESFAAIKTDDVPKWTPDFFRATTGTAYATIIGDLQKAVLETSYSEVERPTHVYMTLKGFEAFLAAHRALGALPDPVNANLGKEGAVTFAGITVDWSRYLINDVKWDLIEAEGGTASAPVLGINWNSLRLNTVRAGGVGSDSIGFIRQVGDMQVHPLLTNVFKRIEWKRQWSVDNGRRSFFTIYGNIDPA
jgi:hypothetical protein